MKAEPSERNEIKSAEAFAAKDLHANRISAFQSMDHWVNKEPSAQIPSGMLGLVEQARYFSHKYIEFLAEVKIDAAEADEFNPTKLESQALNAVLEEWDTIRHALEQRENPRYQEALIDLDHLAFECLSPLFGKENMQGGVFTYFHKLFDIKRFAFSRTPLIGAPFSALHAPEDWLAIPHEAGHYIFWNGTKTFASFNQFYLALQNKLVNAVNAALQGRITGRALHHKGEVFQVWLNWLNEIFADVFGTLVAGPAFAWSMQSQLRANLSVRDLLHSHDEPYHPDAFLRPFIHINVLREMAGEMEIDQDFAKKLKNDADALETSWRASWPADVTSKLPTPDSIGSMEMILQEEVPAIVRIILDADLGESLPCTLREYFRKGILYNVGLHTDVMELVQQIQAHAAPKIDSRLKKAIAARLAIVSGMNPGDVHTALGYRGEDESPKTNDVFELEFAEFIENVTGQVSREEQLKAFRRVLNYSLKEQDFHTHNHPHSH